MILPEYLSRTCVDFKNKNAILESDRSITFGQLDELSDVLSDVLKSKNIKRQPIAVIFENSIEAIIVIFGILKSGNVVVPIDPKSPRGKFEAIVLDCGIKTFLTDTKDSILVSEIKDKNELHNLILEENIEICCSFDNKIIESHKWIEENSPIIDSDLAYILYTSGSTGVPKGVMISHLNIVNYVEDANKIFGFSYNDNLSFLNAIWGDMSLHDIFVSVSVGASLGVFSRNVILKPKEFLNLINKYKLSCLYTGPTILVFLAQLNKLDLINHSDIKTIMWAADVFPVKHLRKWMEECPNLRYYNCFGPTETVSTSTFHLVTSINSKSSVSIGKPYPNTRVLILDKDLKQVQSGEEGELYIGGSSVALGYWNNLVKTNEVFIQNPFNNKYRDLYYRTGDLVIFDEKNDLYFKGRKDNQIKIMGQRVELGEIENAIIEFPVIIECCVVLKRKDQFQGVEMVAFLAVNEILNEPDLLLFLEKKLPKNMIPNKFKVLSKLPKIEGNMKINRKILNDLLGID